jgi:hypothetical protein
MHKIDNIVDGWLSKLKEKVRENPDPENHNYNGDQRYRFSKADINNPFLPCSGIAQHGTLVHPEHVNCAEDDRQS